MAGLSRLDKRVSYSARNVGIVPLQIWWAEQRKQWMFDGPSSCGPRPVRQNPQGMAGPGLTCQRFPARCEHRLALRRESLKGEPMDPDELLARLRQLLKKSYADPLTREEQQAMIDDFEAMDQWLSHPCHGFLPRAWAGPAGDRKVTEAGACGACQKALYPFRHQKPPCDTTEVSRRRKANETFIDVVLCARSAEDGCSLEYITWLHNLQCGGYSLGHYGQTETKNDFDERVGS